jgi:hypothetical protein
LFLTSAAQLKLAGILFQTGHERTGLATTLIG